MTAKELRDQPAFPCGRTTYDFNPGLTKREWFAGQIIQGLISNPNNNGNIQIGTPGGTLSIAFDAAAVKLADAVLIELSKTQ